MPRHQPARTESADVGAGAPARAPARLAARAWLREPLLHFLLLGLVLFAVYAQFDDSQGGSQSPREIVLTEGDMRLLQGAFEAQWQRPPTPAQRERLVEDRIQEEVLYREALALGLDQGDAIVKRRLVQKMQFVTEDLADLQEPTRAELKAWFESHRDAFALPSRVSFRQLYFSPDRRGGRARMDAEAALAKLAGEPQDSRRAATLTDPFMLRDYYAGRTPEQLTREFGAGFAQAIVELEPGAWRGPVESGFGWHLVYVDSVLPGGVAAFEEVEADVRRDWLNERKAQAWSETYAALRAKYTVRLPQADGES
jgi:parvulin-like peptidyl-prolyl isomerase